jgi:hypothetical protein
MKKWYVVIEQNGVKLVSYETVKIEWFGEPYTVYGDWECGEPYRDDCPPVPEYFSLISIENEAGTDVTEDFAEYHDQINMIVLASIHIDQEEAKIREEQ